MRKMRLLGAILKLKYGWFLVSVRIMGKNYRYLTNPGLLKPEKI